MKGIITKYFEDKGFGFIKDENETERFFHVSSIKGKDKFLNNITDYLYTTWLDRKCYVVDFEPYENEKGLNSLNIELTNQVFNEKPTNSEFEALVTDIDYYRDSLTRTSSGYKKGQSAPFGATAGGNGTYRLGYPEVIRELNLYFRRVDDIGWGTIDIRDLALKVNGRSKITDRFVSSLNNHLVGRTVSILPKNNEWYLKDSSVLVI
ncbi:cold-shock protein [Pontibacter locisalis]|uniref:Cold-shock protein n=1 Tax=Pontibacter locisalis TaxID=1719035 RepID=A0ABW5IMN7_9BACT